ncbi:hypothetical protein D3C80_2140210 [compost metagenome]
MANAAVRPVRHLAVSDQLGVEAVVDVVDLRSDGLTVRIAAGAQIATEVVKFAA